MPSLIYVIKQIVMGFNVKKIDKIDITYQAVVSVCR
jgi:hypothetical protein